MPIITISNLFPRPDQPTRAMFNLQLFREMGRRVTGNQLSVIGETDSQQPITNNHYLNICLVPEWRVWRWPAIRRWRMVCPGFRVQGSGELNETEGSGKAEEVFSTIYLPVFYLPVIGRSINWWFTYRALRGRVQCSLLSVIGNANNQQPLTNNRGNGAPCAVLASWLYPDAVAVARLARDLGVPVWLRVHGTDRYHLKNRHRRRLILEAVDTARGVICNARAVADDLVKWGVPADKIHIIPNGVDTSLFRVRNKEELLVNAYSLPAIRAEHNQQPISDNGSASGRTILFVGNLVPIKGPDVLLKAFANIIEQKPAKTAKEEGILPQRHGDTKGESGEENVLRSFQMAGTPFEKIAKHLPGGILEERGDVQQSKPLLPLSSPRLIIIGSGSMRAQLERLARELGIADRVQFLGNRPHHEIARWMNVADVLCLASHSEGMPNVVLEARASGLPVVTTPAGALPELPLDRDYFLVVKSCTPEDLAAGLQDMLSRDLTKRTPDPAIPTWGQTAETILGLIKGVE